MKFLGVLIILGSMASAADINLSPGSSLNVDQGLVGQTISCCSISAGPAVPQRFHADCFVRSGTELLGGVTFNLVTTSSKDLNQQAIAACAEIYSVDESFISVKRVHPIIQF